MRKYLSLGFSKRNRNYLISQPPEAVMPVGTNKKLTKELQVKIWRMRGPHRAVGSPDIVPGIQKALPMCRAVPILRIDVRRPRSLTCGSPTGSEG